MIEGQPLETDSGELTLLIQGSPASLQAAAPRKALVRDLIREHTRGRDFLLSGDVQVEIEWMLNERHRYESHVSPDVDNILKPILDALCGPDGVLIDDCQVQSVSCHWIDWTRHDEQFEVRIRFFPDELVYKAGLIFVHFGCSLCFPFNMDFPPPVLMVFLAQVCQMFEARNELLALGVNESAAGRVMPIQRMFNRTRIAPQFEVRELPTVMRDVESRARAALASASTKEQEYFRKIEPQFRNVLANVDRRFEIRERD